MAIEMGISLAMLESTAQSKSRHEIAFAVEVYSTFRYEANASKRAFFRKSKAMFFCFFAGSLGICTE
ncbi:hypothetical protein HR10_07900 [Porphyromonas gulae]|nr:hypothetical protein HR10_07900 [Porphyromonas gulae]